MGVCLWVLACPRRRPGSRPFSCGCGVHIRCCGHGDLWFRPTATHFFYKRLKKVSKKTLRPERPAPRRGSGFLRSGIHPGALPSGLLRDDLHAMSSTASNGAARQSPDEYLRSACRWGGWIKIKSQSQSKIKIKSGRRANARPVEWWWSISIGVAAGCDFLILAAWLLINTWRLWVTVHQRGRAALAKL